MSLKGIEMIAFGVQNAGESYQWLRRFTKNAHIATMNTANLRK